VTERKQGQSLADIAAQLGGGRNVVAIELTDGDLLTLAHGNAVYFGGDPDVIIRWRPDSEGVDQ